MTAYFPSFFLNILSTQTDKQTDRQTNRQTDKQTDRQTNRQTDRQTDKQTDRQTDVKVQGKDTHQNSDTPDRWYKWHFAICGIHFTNRLPMISSIVLLWGIFTSPLNRKADVYGEIESMQQYKHTYRYRKTDKRDRKTDRQKLR